MHLSLISTCILNSTATFSRIFPKLKINLNKKFYEYLPENTIAEKIYKIRKQHKLERSEFALLINHHISTVQAWEVNNIYPQPSSIKDICDCFNIKISFFGNYYYWFYNNPGIKFKEWKLANEYSYPECAKIFNVSESCIKRIVSGKCKLSYEMYIKFKNRGVFNKVSPKEKISNAIIASSLRSWKESNNYTINDCANILNTSTATIKRLLRGNYTPYKEIYLEMKKNNII